jgi:sporulation protein YlmC with PRC-barrel domain
MEAEDMRHSTIAGSVAAFICLGLSAPLFAAEPPATGTVNSPSASEKSVSATKPGPIADVPGWRQQEIAAELLGTEVRSPQDELLGSVEDLVRSPQTGKIAYLVIAPDGNFGIDGKNVPVPLEDFKITPNANLLVLDTSKVALDAAPRVDPFTTSGIDLQSRTVDTYWKEHLSN